MRCCFSASEILRFWTARMALRRVEDGDEAMLVRDVVVRWGCGWGWWEGGLECMVGWHLVEGSEQGGGEVGVVEVNSVRRRL